MASVEQRILDTETLEATVARWKQAGRQVVLTAGRFETLDEITVTLLKRARALGDALIVVLYNERSDTQVRAEHVAALECVDYLTVLSEEALVPLLQRLQPPYYALLGSYTERDLPIVESVTAFGGFVVVLPRVSEE